MKFLVLVPIYRRHDVLRVFNEGLEVLKGKGYNIEVLAVGDLKDESIAKELGYRYVTHRNILGEKLNKALKVAKNIDFDAMLMLGSDDTLNAEVLDFYIESFNKGYKFVGFLDCYFYDLEKRNMIKWNGYRGHRQGEPIGAWRCFRRDLIEELNYELWANQHHSIDYTMWEKIKKRPDLLKVKLSGNQFICDLKTSENVTKFRKFDNSVITNPLEGLNLLEANFKNKILNYGK
jgi:hypothetical protein